MGTTSLSSFRIDPQTLDFPLPEDRIAQVPLEKRDQARLMVLNRKTESIEHKVFSDLVNILMPSDVLVINHARVNKSKVLGRKVTGGKVEMIFISPLNDSWVWRALVRPFLSVGTEILVGNEAKLIVEGKSEQGENILRFVFGSAEEILNEKGEIPLPPYIKRDQQDIRKKSDEADYQTVFAKVPGSIAAPTAGLHFSNGLLAVLRAKGVQIVELLLNVGWGTFKPIASSVDAHQMLSESFEVSGAALRELKKAKLEKRRVVSVGTTSTRVLESLAPLVNEVDLKGETNLFIKPGFQFRWVDALITNFHVPRSTPVSLTGAFAGLSFLEKAYQEALRNEYRFFSYGDAMLVL